MVAMKTFSKYTLLLLLCLPLHLVSEETVQVIGLLRSGGSFPTNGEILKNIKLDDYAQDSDIYNEVTGNGLRSSYILGLDLVNRYPFIKEKSFNLKDFSMIVSKSNRCLMSAQAILLGIFGLNNDTRQVSVLDELQQPPFNGETIVNSFSTPLPNGIYPVPFESYNSQFNNVLKPWDKYGCKEFSNFNVSQLNEENKYIDDFNETLDRSV